MNMHIWGNSGESSVLQEDVPWAKLPQ